MLEPNTPNRGSNSAINAVRAVIQRIDIRWRVRSRIGQRNLNPTGLAIGCDSAFSQKAARGYGSSLAQCLDC